MFNSKFPCGYLLDRSEQAFTLIEMHIWDARVKTERMVTAAEGPEMHIVHFLHAFDSQYSPGDVFDAQIKRAAFQKNMRGFAQDADAGPEHEQADGEAEKRIDPMRTGRMDD
jgi:hypothetical protein